MIHIDIKKWNASIPPGIKSPDGSMPRSCGAGWKYLHVCIDDYSRVVFYAVMPDEIARSVAAFL